MRKIIKWLETTKLLFPLRRLIAKNLRRFGIAVTIYHDARRSRVIKLIHKIRECPGMLLRLTEAYELYMLVERTKKIPGDIAQVGVFRGGAAKLMSEAKDKRPMYLFDTFDGIPHINDIDADRFHKGQYSAAFESVKKLFEHDEEVSVYKGIFPDTSEPIKSKRFSFVYLDVDVYKSTHDCLEFFYPRLNKGGIILSHDYMTSKGVQKAFDEFFNDKPEPVIEMAGSQCMIVKL